MSYLEKLTPDQKKIITALPYRTGLWISESDKTGGNESDEAEMQALEAIVTSYAQDFLKSEFVEEIMQETLGHKEDWPKWGKDLDDVLHECRHLIEGIAEVIDHHQVTSFKQNLYEIATTVAMAFREYDENQSSVATFSIHMRHRMQKIICSLTKKEPLTLDEMLNISADEEEALIKLKEVLKLDMEEGIHLVQDNSKT